jgi:xanthine dehydrogenase accessory factor
MKNLFETVADTVRAGERSALVIVIRTVGSVPRKVGTKMLIRVDGTTVGTIGGGELEKRVKDEALKAIAQREPRIVSFTLDREKGKLDMMCGGEIDFYIEPILPEARLVVFGAGHITRALAPLMQKAGFQVSVVDDSAELLQKEAFPGVDDLIMDDMERVARDLPPGPDTYVVLLTRGFSRDKAVLRGLLGKGYPYVGMIGSLRKIVSMLEELRSEGQPDEAFSRLCAPIGLDIGAETPEEIALSIAAEIVAVKKGKLDPAQKQRLREAHVGS